MEYIKGKSLHECICTLTDQQKDAIIKKQQDTVQSMHGKKYVHGVLWLPNIIMEDFETDSGSSTPIIIDLDWAGIEGEAKYPFQVVDWPSYEGLNTLNSHDMYVEHLFHWGTLYRQLYSYLRVGSK